MLQRGLRGILLAGGRSGQLNVVQPASGPPLCSDFGVQATVLIHDRLPLVWPTETSPRPEPGHLHHVQASESAYCAESRWRLFKLDTASLERGRASDKSCGFRVDTAAHICPGESSKATAVRKRPAAAKRSCQEHGR